MNSLADLLAASGLNGQRDDRVELLSDGSRVIYLHAGQLHASAEPARITTILGSCVSICLWDPVAAMGGMNHYMLPDDIGANPATPRHANFAIHTLIQQLLSLGTELSRLQARVYGGASVVTSLQGGPHLGARNVEVGRTRLREAGIAIAGEDVGGTSGRKLVFSTGSGLTTLKRI